LDRFRFRLIVSARFGHLLNSVGGNPPSSQREICAAAFSPTPIPFIVKPEIHYPTEFLTVRDCRGYR
jgi:hypothetical protein